MTDVLDLFQYDDLFLFAPSFTIAEELGWPLDEGKYVGTAKEVDLVFLDKDKTMDAFLRPEDFANARKKGVTVGKRALKRIKRRALAELLPVVLAHDRGETWNTDFQKDASTIMRRAWRDVFVAGVRSTGIRGTNPHTPIEFSPADEKWLKGAIKHEMRFLNWGCPRPRCSAGSARRTSASASRASTSSRTGRTTRRTCRRRRALA
jgi:hypothetical protein